MNLENSKIAIKFANEAGISELDAQKLQKFLELCASYYLAIGSEVMREKCAKVRGKYGEILDPNHREKIRSLPGVTLKDLK